MKKWKISMYVKAYPILQSPFFSVKKLARGGWIWNSFDLRIGWDRALSHYFKKYQYNYFSHFFCFSGKIHHKLNSDQIKFSNIWYFPCLPGSTQKLIIGPNNIVGLSYFGRPIFFLIGLKLFSPTYYACRGYVCTQCLLYVRICVGVVSSAPLSLHPH